MKKTIRDIELKGKKAVCRVDFNVPQDKETGAITDDTRIRAAVPTIEYLLRNGAAVILMSHLGRPKDGPDMKYSLAPVAARLEEILGTPVRFISSPVVVDDAVRKAAKELKAGEVLLLENVRFVPEETKNGEAFAKELASLGDLFVNDAFGSAHRAHSSTAGIAAFLPAVSGFLMEKEVRFLGDAVENPERPFVAILGGAKIGDKIPVIENLLNKVDTLIVGGGMAFTFLKAKGYEIGKSLVDDEKIELAKELLAKAREKNVRFLLPVDVVMADEFANDSPSAVYDANAMDPNRMGLDIGPATIRLFRGALQEAKTVVWNGPMGVFEMDNFAKGTNKIAEALAESKAVTIIGGGDSAAAVKKAGLSDKMTHISTGGGASLEFLEGKGLPGVDCLMD